METIVATALFTVVMLIAVGSLLSIVSVNRKAQALHLVMNNLNVALDGMVRAIRTGSNYYCGGGDYEDPQDCSGVDGDTVFFFEPFRGEPDDPEDQWGYWFGWDVNGVGRIYKSEQGGANELAITASTVNIEKLQFHVIGSSRSDETQPKVVIEIKGTANAENVKARTTFHIQATAVQRILDL